MAVGLNVGLSELLRNRRVTRATCVESMTLCTISMESVLSLSCNNTAAAEITSRH